MKRTTQRTELRTVRSTSNRAPASSKASLQFDALASSRNRTNSLHSRLLHRQRLHSDIEANKTYPYAMANTQRRPFAVEQHIHFSFQMLTILIHVHILRYESTRSTGQQKIRHRERCRIPNRLCSRYAYSNTPGEALACRTKSTIRAMKPSLPPIACAPARW